MIIRIWHTCVVLSCIVIPCLFAKPFSLNEAIAAEERQKGLQTTPRFDSDTSSDSTRQTTLYQRQSVADSEHFPSETAERFSLNNFFRIKPLISKKLQNTAEKARRFSRGKKSLKSRLLKPKKLKQKEKILGKEISPIKYKKQFQIKSPLKPKNLKYIRKTRLRRKNQSIERRINNEDEKINKKYIPLLRSFSVLFDNILTEASDSPEVGRPKLKKNRRESKKRHKTECTCSQNTNDISNITESPEETTILTTTDNAVSTIEPTRLSTTETSTTTTDYATISDFSHLRQNTDVPILLSRDTASIRRDYNRVSKGSSATFHTSAEGDFAGDNGNSERDTGSRKYRPHSKDDEENPYSTSREHASSIELGGGLRGDRADIRRPVYRRRFNDKISTESEDESVRKDRRDWNKFERQNNKERKDSLQYIGRDINESEGENKHEARRDETESAESVQQFVRGDRRFISEEVDDNTESIQPKKNNEEGVVGSTHNIASDQRLSDRDVSVATENQETGPANAALISIKDLSNPIIMLQNSPKHKAPYVTIIDGYSIARDKNGANKLAEKSIRFHA